MNKVLSSTQKRFLPIFSIIIAILIHILIPDSDLQPEANKPYFFILLSVLGIIFLILLSLSFKIKAIKNYLEYKGAFFSGAFVTLSIINLLTGKFAILPVLFFPKFDNILAIFAENGFFLLKCTGYSFRLLLCGVFWGITIGFILGVSLGFSRRVNYWINPLIKIIGPIPATVWIPLVLSTFPTTFGASAFIIALAVWFPVTLMTSSGIQNIAKSYFEVSETLGAKTFFKILKIGIPASLPSIFQGIFNGICGAFIALMTAEMFGAKYGIGWYIHWQKGMMVYSGVYAGLILIALFCTIIITALFKIREKMLIWQKGLIKW